MPTRYFTVKVTGLAEAVQDVEALGRRATTLRDTFPKLIGVLVENEKRLWSRDGGGGGQKWPSDSDATIARKVAHGLNPRTMRATDELEKSLTDPSNAKMIHEGGGNILIFGTRVWYAHFAQNAKDPARRRTVLRILPTARRDIRAVVLAHILYGG